MTAQHASQFDLLTLELWLAQRLRQHGAAVFEGVTDRDTRRERARAAILENGLASVVLGRGKSGKPMTYAQAFEALYGEPLDAKSATSSAPLPLSQRYERANGRVRRG